MTTQPTNLPVPSESPRDLKFNAGKIDEFATSMGWTYTDRFGVKHYTIEGLRWIAQQAISAFGYITLDSFEDGNTLTLPNQVLRLESTGEYYRWDGPLPKVVSPGSTPESTGGIGPGAWLSIGDAALRAVLSSEVGYSSLGEFDSVAELRSYTSYASLASGSRISVKSYYAGLGYGGGFFRWSSASTDADDGGYTINPTGNVGPGRWKREFVAAFSARTVSPVEFGAKMNDGTFDSAPAINAAISYLNPYLDASYDSHQGGDVVFPTAQYFINDTIYLSPNVRVIGTGGTSGFRYSRAGCAIIIAMTSMDVNKVLLDTAPWLSDGTARYTVTNSVENGLYLSAGYYGPYIENIVLLGRPDTQAGIRIWRTPDAKLIGVAVYDCKVSFWISGSWGTAVENCFAQGAKYATFLTPHTTALNLVGGYYTGNLSQTWDKGTAQWFHRSGDVSNRPNIAYVTTFLYAHDCVDINMHGVTWEGYNRDFALFYSGNVNVFGGYSESVNVAASETGHRVWCQCVGSTINTFGVFCNHDIKDFVVQSGNTLSSGAVVKTDISQINVRDMKIGSPFKLITKDLGFGRYGIKINCEHPITENIADTLAPLRGYTVQFKGLLDVYTMRSPSIAQGANTFDIQVSNCVAGGEYSCRLLMKNVAVTLQQDLRFNVLVGNVCSVTGYQGRSLVGTSPIPAPSASFNSTTGVLTLTFTGNSANYSLNRLKVIPLEEQPPFTYST
ncbi:hypothetical protein ACEZRV_000871 [Escherichia coli]